MNIIGSPEYQSLWMTRVDQPIRKNKWKQGATPDQGELLAPPSRATPAGLRRKELLEAVPKTPAASLEDLSSAASGLKEGQPAETGLQLHIANARVVESRAYLEFLATLPRQVNVNFLMYLKTLQYLSAQYAVDIIVVDISKLSEYATRLMAHKPYWHSIRHTIVNWKHVESIYRRPGRRYFGIDGRWAAIVKIQATFRMYCQKKVYSDFCMSKIAVRVILEFRRKCMQRFKFLEQSLKSMRLHEVECAKTRADLIAKWKDHMKRSHQVHIHVPSAGYNDRIRFLMKDIRSCELQHAGRLSSAMEDNVRVIYITPQDEDPLIETALRYLARSTRHPKAAVRCAILKPQCMRFIPPTSSVTLALDASYETQAKIRDILSNEGRHASVVMIPLQIDHYVVRVASTLKVPLLALPPAQQTHFASRPGFFEIMRAVDANVKDGDFSSPVINLNAAQTHNGGSLANSVPPTARPATHLKSFGLPAKKLISNKWARTLPHAIDLRDEDTVWKTLAEMLFAYPGVTHWMLRINDEALRRGIAIFHRSRLTFTVSKFQPIEIVRKIRVLPEAFSCLGPRLPGLPVQHTPPTSNSTMDSRSPDVSISRDRASPHKSLYRGHIPNLSWNPHVYQSPSTFISSLCKAGGTMEAFIPGFPSTKLSVGCHVDLHPTGEATLISTWEQIPLYDYDHCLTVIPSCQVNARELFPHLLRILPVCLERGLIGHLTLEFLTCTDTPECILQCVDLKPYWAETASMVGLVRIIGDLRLEFPKFQVMSGRPVGQGSGMVEGDEWPVGIMSTDMAHMKPFNYRMAEQAKWLDYDRIKGDGELLIQKHDWGTGQEKRCAVLVDGIIHPAIQFLTHSSLNATLGACKAEMNDAMRKGALYLATSQRTLLGVGTSYVEAIQYAVDAIAAIIHRINGLGAGDSNCNLKHIVDLLGRARVTYAEIEEPEAVRGALEGLLECPPSDDAYVNDVLRGVHLRPDVRAALAPQISTEERTTIKSPEEAAEMYQAALLAQEMYTLTQKIGEFERAAADMKVVNEEMRKERDQVYKSLKEARRERRREMKKSMEEDKAAEQALEEAAKLEARLASGGQAPAPESQSNATGQGAGVASDGSVDPAGALPDGAITDAGGSRAGSAVATPMDGSVLSLHSILSSRPQSSSTSASPSKPSSAGPKKVSRVEEEESDSDDDDEDEEEGFALDYGAGKKAKRRLSALGSMNPALKIMGKMFKNIHSGGSS